jgi:4-diphosphocytidyl-2-C-methyl-D-erythritol kinase
VRLPGPDYLAPAKLNLFLHVVGRRADGYHLLQSVFVLIAHCDRIRIRVRDDGVIARVNELPGIPPEQDLAVRAARRLKEASGTPLGADLEVEKRIPIGGGLGGGSSDAASVLLALDRLWATNLGVEMLRGLATGLGADVPFFLFGQSAWVEGIGERLAAVDVAARWYLVLVPPVGVSTPAVFAAPELTRNTDPLKMEDFSAQARHRFHNDLAPVVLRRFPAGREHFEWLERHAEARMTGSGGCVFAAFASREEAQRVLDELPAGMHGFIARGLEEHPWRAMIREARATD